MPGLPDTPGYISEVATRELGLVVVTLGGGRSNPSDALTIAQLA